MARRSKAVDKAAFFQRPHTVRETGRDNKSAALFKSLAYPIDCDLKSAFGDEAGLDVGMRMQRPDRGEEENGGIADV